MVDRRYIHTVGRGVRDGPLHVRPQHRVEVVPLPHVLARLDGHLRLARPALPSDGHARREGINQELHYSLPCGDRAVCKKVNSSKTERLIAF